MRALLLGALTLTTACSISDYAVVPQDQHTLLTPAKPYDRERVFPGEPDVMGVTPGSTLQLLRRDGTCTRKVPMRDVRTNDQGIWFVRDHDEPGALGPKRRLSSARLATVAKLAPEDRERLQERAPEGCTLTAVVEDGTQVEELRCEKASVTGWIAAALEREAPQAAVAGPATAAPRAPTPKPRDIKEMSGAWRFSLYDGVGTGERFTFAERPEAWTDGVAVPDGIRWADVEEMYVWTTNGAKMAVGLGPNYLLSTLGVKLPDMGPAPICAKKTSAWTMRGDAMEAPDTSRTPTALFESSMIRKSQARFRLSVEGGLDVQDTRAWTGGVGIGGRFLELLEIEGTYRQLQLPWDGTPTALSQVMLQGGLHLDLDYERNLGLFFGGGIGWGWDAAEENHEAHRVRVGVRWRPWSNVYVEAYPFNPTRLHRTGTDTVAERTRWFWLTSLGIGVEL